MKRFINEETLEFPLETKLPINSKFGHRDIVKGSKEHKGVDIGAPEGTKIKTVLDGEVVRVSPESESGGYGNMVIVKHKDFFTLYGHMSKILTKLGDKVSKGQVIGLVGSTGVSTGNHLHFEIRKTQDGDQIDPEPYLNNTSINPPVDPSINPSDEITKIDLPIDNLLKMIYDKSNLGKITAESIQQDIKNIKRLL